MGNLFDCGDNVVIPSEEKIREIISSIKIGSYKMIEIKNKINNILMDNSDMESIKEELSNFFYEKDELTNNWVKIHEEIFNKFFEFLEKGLNINQIILIIFPLSKQGSNQNIDLTDIIRDLCGEKISYNRIYVLLMYVFEFYTITITKIIKENINDPLIKKESEILITSHFTNEKIQDSVSLALKKFDSEDIERKSINLNELVEDLNEKKVNKYEEIRSFVINTI